MQMLVLTVSREFARNIRDDAGLRRRVVGWMEYENGKGRYVRMAKLILQCVSSLCIMRCNAMRCYAPYLWYSLRYMYNAVPFVYVNKILASSWLIITSSFSKEYFRLTTSKTIKPALVLGTCLMVFIKKSRYKYLLQPPARFAKILHCAKVSS